MADNITKDRTRRTERQEQERRNPRDRGDFSRSYRNCPGDADTDKKTGDQRTGAGDNKRPWKETDKSGNIHTKSSETRTTNDGSKHTTTTRTSDSWTDKKSGIERQRDTETTVTKDKSDCSTTTSNTTTDRTTQKDGKTTWKVTTQTETRDRNNNKTHEEKQTKTYSADNKWGI
ncbi:hypothetical protein MSP7336_01260 [Mycobacterium shimoidei]|uniref:Uncharacterized protein n=1 Tax=Mycobacterium shimoidei TaxID=29313 RepID=A0A375YWF1_MYCSH|nr:hypothetical protein [Mycobacterium shimoidei]SRX93030.1 hypothetical protein MSP7336_01260 [Mycobacterium shimoidei]